MIAIHIKSYCENCGTLLHHERVEIPEKSEHPFDRYIGQNIPLCEGCFASLLIEKGVGN